MQSTFVALKPDAVQRGLIHEVLGRFEKKGLKLIALKMMRVSSELAEKHYGEHQGKPFYDDLIRFITSGPIVAMVWHGKEAVSQARHIMGATNPLEAEPGTIRADFGMDMPRNLVHGSDSEDSARREIALFFNEDELLPNWDRGLDSWIYLLK